MGITQKDAVEWLRETPSESVDLVVTDPAHESLEKHRAVGTTTRCKKRWFPIFKNERFEELYSEIYRVLKPDTHFYLICDQTTMWTAKPIGEKVGFKFWKPIVWDKISTGMGYHYRGMYEVVLFFEKGKRPLRNRSIGDVLHVKSIRGGCRCSVPADIYACSTCEKRIFYPTEKPVELGEILIEQSTQPGECVIDPFAGAGFVGVAAQNLDREFQLNDVNPVATEWISKRLAKEKSRVLLRAV